MGEPEFDYSDELRKLHVELAHLQAWVRREGLRIVVVFEGRDAAGKGGVIKALTEKVSPRVFRKVALPAPTDREKTQLYSQRYLAHMPAAGEVVIFDRSWYNRAGVEVVMGFCKEEERDHFLQTTPVLEKLLVDDGIILIKYWLEVSQDEQLKRFQDRVDDTRKHWKFSPMDPESRRRWYAYSRARDTMMNATDTEYAPWHIVRSDDKHRARLNCIKHFLSQIDYSDKADPDVELPEIDQSDAYDDKTPMEGRRYIDEVF